MGNQIVVNAGKEKNTIDKMIYGHFAEHLGHCVYEGIWVGENSTIPNTRGIRNDIVEALRKIKIPCLRWPGGCFADEYHWKDGVGPKENRKEMVNTHWGKVVENNHFGTHEFFDLCQMLDTEPYICGNVGSGTVQEMQEWVEYMTFDGLSPMTNWRKQNGRQEPWKLKYFGVGNENWGCGGRMTAEFYADQFTRYNQYVRDLGDNKLFRIAAGPRSDNYHWTEVLMRQAWMHMDGLALHYYARLGDPTAELTLPDGNRRYVNAPSFDRKSATDFDENDWFHTMKAALHTETLIKKHSDIMDKYDPDKKVALIIDEWGTWFNSEPGTNPAFLYQQNTLRDALVASTSLNIFNNHSDRVRMTNIAQVINVLQAVILTQGEKMLLTPTYYVYDLYKVHQDAQLLDFAMVSDDYVCNGEVLPKVNASVSKDKDGRVHMTLCNIHPCEGAHVSCSIADQPTGRVTGSILTHEKMQAFNDFDDPEKVKPQEFTSFKVNGNTLHIDMPSKSIVLLSIG
jgi:alpha-L-arabinofuranosidase